MKKLLQQALDALQSVSEYINRYSIPAHQLDLEEIDGAAEALCAAIVQPEGKPVGEVLPKWEGGYQVRLLGPVRVGDKLYKESNREAELAARVVRLEAELAVLNQQEPVAAVYTQFRDITDDQLNRLADMSTPNTETGALNYRMFARALEREIRGGK